MVRKVMIGPVCFGVVRLSMALPVVYVFTSLPSCSDPVSTRTTHIIAARTTGRRQIIYVVNMNVSQNSVASARQIANVVEEITGVPAVVENYRYATYERVKALGPIGIVLSGQSSPWEDYSRRSLEPAMEMVRRTDVPILGICGGHQFIALAYSGRVDRIKRLKSGKGYEGCFRERGYVKIRTSVTDHLLGPAGSTLTVYESHCDEIKRLPNQFAVLASNSTCHVQAVKHRTRQVYGVQFHPELYSESRPDGYRLMSRFMKLCLNGSADRKAAR